jgi:polygalacturonase
MKTPLKLALVLSCASLLPLRAAPPATSLPAWTKEVGARRTPPAEKVFAVKNFGAIADGSTIATTGIQKAIDAASAAGGGVVTFDPGTYVSGAIFVKSHVHLRIDEGVTLLGIADEAAYPRMPTRIAGIEMEWPSALINMYEQEDVKLSGGGIIDGNGEWCWTKYWTMRRDYEARGLRWAADYDAERVRLMVVWKSRDVTLQNLHLRRSGFWTVQVCYSDHVTVDGITIRDNERGPSTDGVDIDSSSYVLVQRCDIDNNDDDICLKSGRDWDGMRVHRPAEYVFIRDNLARRGGGIVSFGSETSGDIRHIVALGNRGLGTSEGIRFKSAKTRGGIVEDVLVLDTKMENVARPFTFTLNWNPSYSYATLPTDLSKLPPALHGKIPEYWRVMNTPIEPPSRGIAEFRDITIANVEITGARQIFSAAGMAEKPIHDVRLENITAHGTAAGTIEYAKDWTVKNVTVITPGGQDVRISDSEKVPAPVAKRAPAGSAQPATPEAKK